MSAPPETIVKKIEILQRQTQKIEGDLQDMKQKARAGEKIPPAELDMTVRDIHELRRLIDENGH